MAAGETKAMQHSPARYFSVDYAQARTRFLKAATDAGARIDTALNPAARGPGGIGLSMDCATLGPADADRVFVMISGTHGPEGYCGSGVQTGLMESGRAAALAARCRVVLVHAHNPYGFAWDTRFNEDNIDLNRNYLDRFDAPLPDNPAYRAIAHWAAPERRDEATLADAQAGLLGYAAEHGFGALQSALSGGQYSHPKGVYFGGHGPSWSRRTLEGFLSAAMAGAGRIVCVDMHTGLGPLGHGEIITESPPGSAHHDRLDSVWPGQIRSTQDGSSVSAHLTGTMDAALLKLAGERWSAFMALEFGTIDPMSVFQATQASSWLHCHGDPEGPDAGPIRTASRAAFYPETDAWKEAVWARSLEILDAAEAALDR